MKEINLLFENKTETLYWFRNVSITMEFDLDMDTVIDRNRRTIIWKTYKKKKSGFFARLFGKQEVEPITIVINFLNLNTVDDCVGILIQKDVELDFIINLIKSEAKND